MKSVIGLSLALLLGVTTMPAVAAAAGAADGAFVLANVAPPEEPVPAPPPTDGTAPAAEGTTAPAEATAPPAEATPDAPPAADASAATPAEAAPATAEPEKSGGRFLPIIIGLVVAFVIIFGVVMARRKA